MILLLLERDIAIIIYFRLAIAADFRRFRFSVSRFTMSLFSGYDGRLRRFIAHSPRLRVMIFFIRH